MSLLREIQSTAVDANSDIATLLRKCKILSVRLGNDEFRRWVDSELNGYNEVSELPEYRKLRVESLGHFSGPFGSALNYAPIPPSCLPEKFRERLNHSYLMQPISAYSSLIDNSERSNPIEKWPADVVVIVGGNIYRDMNCMSAWKVIPYNALVAVVDTIKTRILNFCLEIEAEAPDAGEAPPNTTPVPLEKVSQVFNTYISGNVQNVATGSSHFTQEATNADAREVFGQLLEAISKAETDKFTIEEVSSAVVQMKEAHGTSSFGKRYQSFIAVLADHMQVFGPLVAPYLPLLAKMVI